VGHLQLVTTVDLHPDVDNDSGVHGLILQDLQERNRRLDENRELQARRHGDNSAALHELAEKLDQHADAVARIRPTTAALELSRSKLATLASVGLEAVMILGSIVEASLKWTLSWALSHFQ